MKKIKEIKEIKEIIYVAAAIIKNGKDEFLICRRPEGKNLALYWEFPGGKLEPGETPENCLIREIREELNADIAVRQKYDDVLHEYPDRTVHITFFECDITGGILTAKEHGDMQWVKADLFRDYMFCPADLEVVRKLSAGQTADGQMFLQL